MMDLIITRQGIAVYGALTAIGLATFVLWDERRKRG